MYAPERQAAISAVISAEGRAGVAELAERFDVTTETIRRDLDALERAGLIRRVHGGAVAPDRGSVVERPVLQRNDVARSAKSRIAQAALPFVPADSASALLLDAGTSVGALAELLLDWRGPQPEDALPVITHSVTVAALLARSASIDLHVLGGRVRRVTDAAVGPTTLEQISRLRPDVAVLGTNGISAAAGLTTPDEAEAAVKAAMVRAARRVIVLADSSKLEEETLVVFAGLADIDVLVTDAEPPAALARALADADVDVVIA
ncbi:DeoR/GlpR family DNA-binding transcription regulator [Naasia sp. SYSU D00948]|uniref:DeoR/GlpR family DNA-binding transcription regulator n=1 Tax=Naasia sp. SYSU D00948 TaxID=2817379 RepID=UPI001B309449|nr:DeoR/GlpR family DNA-binding transcription regulator [Naasia sp. SYSU D00948]